MGLPPVPVHGRYTGHQGKPDALPHREGWQQDPLRSRRDRRGGGVPSQARSRRAVSFSETARCFSLPPSGAQGGWTHERPTARPTLAVPAVRHGGRWSGSWADNSAYMFPYAEGPGDRNAVCRGPLFDFHRVLFSGSFSPGPGSAMGRSGGRCPGHPADTPPS